MKIRNRLFLTHFALSTVGMALLASWVLWSFRGYYLRNAETDLAGRATAIGESVTDWLERGDLGRVNLVVQRYGAPRDITLRVFDPAGRMLASSDAEVDRRVRNWLAVPDLAAAVHGTPSRGVGRALVGSDDRLYETRPLVRGGRQLGVVRISLTLSHFQKQLWRSVWTVTLALALALVACALLSARLARSFAEPIREMRDFAAQLGRGHFAERMPEGRRDELGELAADLNRMSQRLAALDEERRSFLANVSHELRTPVSNVQVTLEALEGGAQDEPELRTRFMRTALDETGRLARLVQDLLDLGRLEAGVALLESQPLRVKLLLERCARAVEPRMLAKGIDAALEIEDVELYGDSERLMQAFMNVLDNAVKHSPAGTRVHIVSRAESGGARIEFSDGGAGIAERDLPHVFEQFYTGDTSRKRGAAGGTGLGLAITRRIVEAHGGTVSAGNARGAGARITVFLPARTAVVEAARGASSS